MGPTQSAWAHPPDVACRDTLWASPALGAADAIVHSTYDQLIHNLWRALLQFYTGSYDKTVKCWDRQAGQVRSQALKRASCSVLCSLLL